MNNRLADILMQLKHELERHGLQDMPELRFQNPGDAIYLGTLLTPPHNRTVDVLKSEIKFMDFKITYP